MYNFPSRVQETQFDLLRKQHRELEGTFLEKENELRSVKNLLTESEANQS